MSSRLDSLQRTQLKSWGIRPAGSKFDPEGVRNRCGLAAPDDVSRPTGAVLATREDRQTASCCRRRPVSRAMCSGAGAWGVQLYQEDAAVSRELIHQPTGALTLFAFDAQQGLSEHTASCDALVLVTDGRAEIRVARATYEVKAGGLLLLPANGSHALVALEPFTGLCITC